MNKCNHILISLVLIMVMFTSVLFVKVIDSEHNYVSSTYSKYCYPKGEENKNIKHKVYYQSLEECGKTLKI